VVVFDFPARPGQPVATPVQGRFRNDTTSLITLSKSYHQTLTTDSRSAGSIVFPRAMLSGTFPMTEKLLPTSAGWERVSAATAATTGAAILTVGSTLWIVVADGARRFGAAEIGGAGAEQLRFRESSSFKSSKAT
jgi:hypothetical protein